VFSVFGLRVRCFLGRQYGCALGYMKPWALGGSQITRVNPGTRVEPGLTRFIQIRRPCSCLPPPHARTRTHTRLQDTGPSAYSPWYMAYGSYGLWPMNIYHMYIYRHARARAVATRTWRGYRTTCRDTGQCVVPSANNKPIPNGHLIPAAAAAAALPIACAACSGSGGQSTTYLLPSTLFST
jgi:hypothetical protein